MPQLLPAAAAWATAAWSSAVTATAVGLTKVGVMAALGEGATIALAGKIVATTAAFGLSAAAAALMRPNTPSSGSTLDFKPDPKAPVRGAMGYTALGGNKVFQATWGYNKVAMSLGVALSLGPIDAITQFRADNSVVAFTGPQNEATGFYQADMWQKTTLGLPTDAALLPPTGLKYGSPGLTGWGTQHAAPQVSFAFWTMVLAKNPEDRNIFTNGVPDPRWVGRWMKLWDPRKDSTYPGGSGPQRRDDWRTWEWSESPYVHALAWARGHFKLNADGTIDRTKRIAGIGAPDAAIDIPAFVEAMNIAEANGWTISGEWSTGDGKFQTWLAMLQAGGGEPISRGAQLSVMVNAPRVATYTYTRDDLIGQAEVRPLTPRRERKNTIVPRYRSEANNWEYVPAGEVTSSVYRDEDRGEPRTVEIEFTHVRDARQAGQLAAYTLANLREGLTVTLPSKAHLMHVHAGECIKIDVPELALADQKVIVRRTTVNHQSASVTLECRSESDAKHAWALGQAAQPAPSPALSAVDPRYVPPPASADWTVAPKPPTSGGISQPIFTITVPIETADIVGVIIKHGPSASGPWTRGYEGAPSADGRYEIAGLTPGQSYCLSLQYVAKNGATSDPSIKCGNVAGDLTSGNVIPTAPTITNLQSQITTAFGDIFDVSGLLAEARTDLDAVEAEVVAARGGSANLAARVAAVNQARIDGDTANALAISGVLARTAQTEADIIDLENAQANDRMATAQAISQLSASSTGSLNLNPNFAHYPSGTPSNVPPAWEGWGSTRDQQRVPGRFSSWAFQQHDNLGGVREDCGIAQTASQNPGLSNVAASYYVLEADVRLLAGGLRGAGIYAYCTGGGDGVHFQFGLEADVNGYIGHTTTHPSRSFRKLVRINNVGDGNMVLHAMTSWAGGWGLSDPKILVWDRCAIRPATAQEVAAGIALPQLQATVTEQSLAIIDLENQQNIASWYVKAAASGGKPAVLGVFSSTYGSGIALGAEQVFLGDNTTIDTVTQTQQGVWGSTRRVIANGPPFGPDNLIHWAGPSNIALSAMTKANAGFWQDQNGMYGPTPVPLFWAKATPSVVTKTRTGAGSIATNVNDVIVTCLGGTSGATCTWSRVSGDASISFPSSSFTPTFSTTLTVGQIKTAVFAGLVIKGGETALVYLTVEFQETT
ncbi:phage tail protein [Brevundimonas sp. GN22]